MRRSRKLVLLGIVIAVIIPVASELVQAYRTSVVIPALSGGSVSARTGRAPGILATMIRPIYNLPGTFLTYYFPHESPLIGAAQPEDAVIFTCPAGTSIPVSQALSRFGDGRNQWVWGPYQGDEADRIARGDPPENVFPLTRFMGRASGFPFVDAARSLTVAADDADGGLFFATADPPPGSRYAVRCRVPAAAVCGDSFIDGPEQCDDGPGNSNSAPGACRSNCLRARCGDGAQDPAEECDDGNQVNADGCTNTCQTQLPSPCGNGVVNPGEACDDGNTAAGDGCSAACQAEAGYSCSGTPSTCELTASNPVCGNGRQEGTEQCDDGNASNTDSCLTDCTANVCGDGIVNVGTEACDDGRTCLGTDGSGSPTGDGRWCTTDADCASQPGTACAVHSGDGCSVSCAIEPLSACQLRPDRSASPERSQCTFVVPGITSSAPGFTSSPPPPPPPGGPGAGPPSSPPGGGPPGGAATSMGGPPPSGPGSTQP